MVFGEVRGFRYYCVFFKYLIEYLKLEFFILAWFFGLFGINFVLILFFVNFIFIIKENNITYL